MVCDLMVDLGYFAFLTAKSNDQGIDLFLRNKIGDIPIQCKNHAKPVSPIMIREFQGACLNYEKSIFVSSNGYSKNAVSQARNTKMLLLDVGHLIKLNDRDNVQIEKLMKFVTS